MWCARVYAGPTKDVAIVVAVVVIIVAASVVVAASDDVDKWTRCLTSALHCSLNLASSSDSPKAFIVVGAAAAVVAVADKKRAAGET